MKAPIIERHVSLKGKLKSEGLLLPLLQRSSDRFQLLAVFRESAFHFETAPIPVFEDETIKSKVVDFASQNKTV